MSTHTRHLEVVEMETIERYYKPGHGRHWFDKDTMKFFGTRLPQTGYNGEGGLYFVSSEKPPHGPRRYTVRWVVKPGKIETVGPLAEWSRTHAHAIAKQLAAGIKHPRDVGCSLFEYGGDKRRAELEGHIHRAPVEKVFEAGW